MVGDEGFGRAGQGRIGVLPVDRRERRSLRGRGLLDELALASPQMLEHRVGGRLSVTLGQRAEDTRVLGDARDEQRAIVQDEVRDHAGYQLPLCRHDAHHLSVVGDRRQRLVQLGIEFDVAARGRRGRPRGPGVDALT